MPRKWAFFPRFSLPVVAVRIGGTIVRALVDTGASQSLIDPRLAKQLGLTNLRIGAQLILGISAFSGYRLQFDFAEGKLYLFS